MILIAILLDKVEVWHVIFLSRRLCTTDQLIITLYSFYYSFMGRGVIEVPFNEVVTLVKDVQNNHIWDKFIVVSLCK